MKWIKNKFKKFIKRDEGSSNIIEAFFGFIMIWAVIALGVYIYTGYMLQQDVSSVSNAVGRNLITMGCKSERTNYLATVSNNLNSKNGTKYAVIINVNGGRYAQKAENGGFSVNSTAWKHGEKLEVSIVGKTTAFMIFPLPVKSASAEFSVDNLITPTSSGDILKEESTNYMIEEDRCFN